MLPKGAPKPKTIGASMSLTDSRIRTLKPNGRADRLIADGGGLYIRVRSGQSAVLRTWQYRRRDSRKLSILTLGTYPDLTVRDARLRAAELAARGNPNTTTIQEAASQWFAERVDTSIRKADQVRGYIERAILPSLGTRRVRDVQRPRSRGSSAIIATVWPSCRAPEAAAVQRRGRCWPFSRGYLAMPWRMVGLPSRQWRN
jgi:hypothetical protein